MRYAFIITEEVNNKHYKLKIVEACYYFFNILIFPAFSSYLKQVSNKIPSYFQLLSEEVKYQRRMLLEDKTGISLHR